MMIVLLEEFKKWNHFFDSWSKCTIPLCSITPKCSQKGSDFPKKLFFMEFYIFSWSIYAIMLSLLSIRSGNRILIDRDKIKQWKTIGNLKSNNFLGFFHLFNRPLKTFLKRSESDFCITKSDKMTLCKLPVIKLFYFWGYKSTFVESLSLGFMIENRKNAILLYDVWIKSGDTFFADEAVAFSLSNFYST